jgi:hypothetical protein
MSWWPPYSIPIEKPPESSSGVPAQMASNAVSLSRARDRMAAAVSHAQQRSLLEDE